ncbi:hypothetical protein A5886_000967 [Enterococcus sp. 8G7_MSG3316]|uniref:WxL domain-containing protein n=1 Tax=Candidatus Enterococcus testudinis TaxID=1834191 RepID=A0A242A580_9ENTE|nr:WxL domain-containing protein [Enterococcus sp. 8G7_MSG3316]OTN75891.1 hypothetical protein A5886_000967 [Enterococcus sp. 8G7_MSG3316]
MKFVKLAAVTAITAGLVGGTIVASAAEETRSLDTEGTVDFREADDDNNETIDPEPGPEEEITIPGTQQGAFALAYVGNYDFGTRPNSALNQSYNAAAWWFDIDPDSEEYGNPEWPEGEEPDYINVYDGTAARAHFAQVRDLRSDLTGWNLALKQAGQFKSGDKELKGAKITFQNGVAQNTSGEVPNVNNNPFTIEPEESRVIMSTKSNDEGFGLSSVMWGVKADLTLDKDVTGGLSNPSVQLSVPGSTRTSAGEAYKTTLEWTLQSGPENIVEDEDNI